MKKILLPLLFFANISFGQVDLNLGLKAYYPFTGNANDVSGNNNNPVFNNATLTADRVGNPNSAYHFDGATTYMQVPNSTSLNTTNKLSLCAWVKPMGFYSGPCHGNSVITKGNTGITPGMYFIWYDDNAGTNGSNCGGPLNPAVENFYGPAAMTAPPGYTPYIQTNQWYSVVVTYDGITAKLYINCELKNSVSQTGLNFTNGDDLFFGRLNSASFPYWVNGDIDEIRIYDRALNQDEVNVLGGCTALSCSNWLRTQAIGQKVTVGDLDISGNQVTVEANFNCSSFPVSRPDKWEDIVSKHSGTNDANYVLRMDLAAITTSTGHYLTPPPCDNLVLNKTYHVAMVYDGSNLKLYRDGYLISQIACTGNLVTNDLLSTIGDYAVNNPVGTNFLGYINEVRIWNVARTQAQLRSFMDIPLPNPTTQTGLQGYYTFDNLLNKQGNAAYNGTLSGGASINNTNPNCSFILDSCPVTINNIINDYTPILAYNICENKITVEDATKYYAGDTVLMIQMKGALIDSTNTAGFGIISDYKNAGNYEFNYVKSKSGNIIELKNKNIRQYDIPIGKVQLVRVPYYTDVSVTGTLTCLPWDGKKGGILVLNAANSVDLNADIDVNGRGFKGGQALTNIPGTGMYNQTDYAYPANLVDGSRKGEGITDVSENLIFCRGPLASGGGGGNSSNAGGGGGGNGGVGGRGGNEWGGSPVVLSNGGLGGKNYAYVSAANKIFMGGAGGAGHGNDATATPGGNGAGIVMINTNTIRPNSRKIIANGAQGPDCLNINTCADAVGGGGAGGTIMINAQTITGNFQIQANGGKGADNNINGPNAHGPGGGGAGGALLVNSAGLLGNITLTTTGGAAGRAFNQGNSNWGALPGNNGLSVSNFNIPFSTTAFKKNIDSVRIKDSLMVCKSFSFKGLAFINTNAISTWVWSFGDGANASTQNTTHTYASAGTYLVKLVVTDVNGCMDSITKSIGIIPFVADAGNDTTICTGSPVSLQLQASAGSTYAWTPAAALNNPSIQNPVATITVSTIFYVTITNAAGCTGTDSVRILVVGAPAGIRYPGMNAFTNQPVQLQARNLGGNSYQWLPPVGLNNSLVINPVFKHNQSQEFIIRIRNASGCMVTDTVLITVKGTKGIYVPRAFSPNSNGTNDRLYPILVGISKLNYFRVFNRWGNLVFETNSGNPAAGWDGKINGFSQPVETYTWTVEGIDIDGIIIRKSGSTLLVR